MSLIVVDIGGTNARLAFQKNINSEICLIENFLCSEFKSLEDIITAYIHHNFISKNIPIDIIHLLCKYLHRIELDIANTDLPYHYAQKKYYTSKEERDIARYLLSSAIR